MFAKPVVVAASLLVFSLTTSSALALQSTKLVGTGWAGQAFQGWSVSMAGDGNTAIVGGFADNGSIGAAWVFTRSGGHAWTQQGSKLVGIGASGSSSQGMSVSLSADGNTAVVGGPGDSGNAGAVWVYTRTGGVWNVQAKLTGTGAVGSAYQGASVSISADGNTILVGGSNDNANVGAAWVFTRSGTVWSQQGAKLVGTGAVGTSIQGGSVALSADGNTAVVGGYGDNSNAGAVWVYTRSLGVWTQQGSKVNGIGAIGAAFQGRAVSLSADGSTLLVGGNGDNGNNGAAWVFVRSGGTWTQQGAKLNASDALGQDGQGFSLALAADGNTAVVGGPLGYGGGGVWIYKRSGGVWSQQGNKQVGAGAVGPTSQGYSVSVSADGNSPLVGGYGDNSLVGAAWVFFDATPDPAVIASALDIPNDQGGWLRLTFDRSVADNAIEPYPISFYGVWRSVPAAPDFVSSGRPGAPKSAELDRLRVLLPEGLDLREVDGRIFATGSRSSSIQATTAAFPPGTWELVANVPALQQAQYVVAVPTISNAAPNDYVVSAHTTTPSIWSVGAPVSGQSIDNLAPAPPAPFTAGYSSGATNLQWGANAEHDLGGYRLYRGTSAGFTPGPANLIQTQSTTGYADPGPPGRYYKLSAVDVNGNESGFSLVTPETTTGVGDGVVARFELEGARPNPTNGDRLQVSFVLPGTTSARLELVDLSGRHVLSREVGSLGAGRHTLDLSQGRKIVPGLYWVRLSQGKNLRTTRVAVVE